VVYRLLADRIPAGANYWRRREFFEVETDSPHITSLEWSLSSPPALHTYNELPFMLVYKH
jgi:heme/copper-type cytochrome/quinol oxidase subunit 1